MVNYRCTRCGYNTDHKSKFRLHLLKKTTCPPKLNETSIYDLLHLNGFYEEALKYKDVIQNVIHFNPNVIHCSPPNKKFICPNCNKSFVTRQSKYKHIKHNCSVLKTTEQTVLEQNKLLIENNEKLVSQVEQNNILNKKLVSQVEKLINKVLVLENKPQSKIKNIINGNVNNSNKIIINNYGSENTSYITDKALRKMLNNPKSAIVRLIKEIYFNGNHPENHTVKKSNIHDKFIHVIIDDKWVLKNSIETIKDIVDNSNQHFELYKEDNDKNFDLDLIKKYNIHDKQWTDNHGQLCKDTELVIINESKK